MSSPSNQYRLHSTLGGSDKVYELWYEVGHVNVWGEPDGYNVIYANGRRVSGAKRGKKPKNPRPLIKQEAQRLLITCVEDKLARGYHEWGGCALCGGTSQAVAPKVAKVPQRQAVMAPAKVVTVQPAIRERRLALDKDI